MGMREDLLSRIRAMNPTESDQLNKHWFDNLLQAIAMCCPAEQESNQALHEEAASAALTVLENRVPETLPAISQSFDPYRHIAASLFSTPYADVTPQQRELAKVRCFAALYGNKPR